MNNEGFTENDRHYINFMLKNDKCLQASIQHDNDTFNKAAGKFCGSITQSVDKHKLDNYISRQVRRSLNPLRANTGDYFIIKSNKYNYSDKDVHIPTLSDISAEIPEAYSFR